MDSRLKLAEVNLDILKLGFAKKLQSKGCHHAHVIRYELCHSLELLLRVGTYSIIVFRK